MSVLVRTLLFSELLVRVFGRLPEDRDEEVRMMNKVRLASKYTDRVMVLVDGYENWSNTLRFNEEAHRYRFLQESDLEKFVKVMREENYLLGATNG
jgi:hypothetical protein